uniref:Uncharacterized protein n=1 Tax=Rhizophora mucronata TaxID=61149 RepID=A0A2P2PN91_RHIMU
MTEWVKPVPVPTMMRSKVVGSIGGHGGGSSMALVDRIDAEATILWPMVASRN